MGVERSFAGPLRVSDLLAMEMAEGRVPTTEELIDVALGWTGAGPAAITRPELFSFFEKSLAPALERAGRGSTFIGFVRDILERVPEKLYRPVTDIALPSNIKTKLISQFRVPTRLAEEYYKWLIEPERRGLAFKHPSAKQPFIIALNPKTMRATTPVHEMMHYYSYPEIFSDTVREVIEEAYKSQISPVLKPGLEYLTSTALHKPSEIIAELGAQYLVAPLHAKPYWAGVIGKLPIPYQIWLRSILTRLGENI